MASKTEQKLIRIDIDSHREIELRSIAFGPFETSREVVALALSPDGQQVAMIIMGGAVEVMPAGGGQTRELFRPAAREVGTGAMLQGLGWTPDQRFVLFARGDQSFWKVPALGGQAEPVGISRVKSPAVRPDGKRIVFHTGGGASAKVWALENVLPAQPPTK